MKYRTAFAPRARLASACLAWLGMGLALPAWSMDLRQAYEAAYENDATIRAARAGAEASPVGTAKPMTVPGAGSYDVTPTWL